MNRHANWWRKPLSCRFNLVPLMAMAVCCVALATPADAVPVVGPYGTGTLVGIGRVSTDDFSHGNAASYFSNNGYTSTTQLLFGNLDNGLTSDSISGSRSAAGATASGNAAANLAGGTLKAYSTSFGTEPFNGDTYPYFMTVSLAGFEDTLTAKQAGTMHFAIDISGTTGSIIWPSVVSGGIQLIANGKALIGTFGEYNADGCIEAGGCSYAVDVPNLSIGDLVAFSLVLQVNAANSTGDFSHTLSLGVTGVSFSSASGVFLTAAAPPSTPVPEPPTFVLLATALAGLWVARRLARHPRAER
jgi:hypothetical protein